jgi:1,4-dihydroxy-6-naphthoate synthase
MDFLRLAYSPCPNDTFIFHAWVQGLLPDAPPVEERLEDIDSLNRLAADGEADVVKVSFYAFAHLRERYALLHSGGALGRGCGPLIVARKDSLLRPADSAGGVALLADDLSRVRVAIPGDLTTAALLSGLFTGSVRQRVVMPFDRIMPAVAAGEVEAGVIIHEGRFTFGSYGLRRLVDLGEWWESTTGLPVPLGAIAVSRALDIEVQRQVERAVSESVSYAWAHPEASRDYVAAHSQEIDPLVCQAHIDLYVNEATLDYGAEGEQAIERILAAASDAGLVDPSEKSLFWDRAQP